MTPDLEPDKKMSKQIVNKQKTYNLRSALLVLKVKIKPIG